MDLLDALFTDEVTPPQPDVAPSRVSLATLTAASTPAPTPPLRHIFVPTHRVAGHYAQQRFMAGVAAAARGQGPVPAMTMPAATPPEFTLAPPTPVMAPTIRRGHDMPGRAF